MRKYQRKQINKMLIITASILVVAAIIMGILIFLINKNKKEEIKYEDTLINKNYFIEMTVDLENKKVKRDKVETTLAQEFDITEEQENLLYTSQQDLINFFADSTFDIEIKENMAYITNKFQTKKIIIEADTIKDDFHAEKMSNLQDGLFLLEYDTQKRTKAAYEFFQTADWIKNMECDKVLYINQTNDESQTVYGEKEETNENNFNTYGTQAMGLENYKNIIKDNGNPSEVVVATIGYGARIEDQYFQGRINDNYYNFLEDSKNVPETIPQGSRVLEVIKETTTDNVKIMPLVVVNSEGYTTTATIIKAIEFAIQNSDVICYELINENNYMIDLSLQNAFKENKPISCVTSSIQEKGKQEQEQEQGIYPANNATTIAVSSIDKNFNITSFSGRGNYIDFSAHSTDIKEIFDKNIGVSKWSGVQYSNAHIVSAMALIKTYNKGATILEVYNVLRNYAKDLGDKGKDILYGYGCPDFSKITIKDIDKQAPEIKEVRYDNTNWETVKKIQIIASDNIRIKSWGITTSEKPPKKWDDLKEVTPTLDVTETITENNKYYIWVKDSAGNISYMPIEINKIDSTGPTIAYTIDDSTLANENYVTLSIQAEDKDSGLNELAYSWDKENWGKDNNILKVIENGRHKIYVRDALGNISEKEIIIDVFPREGVANISEGTIIKSVVVSSSWNGNTNDNVRITFNSNLNIKGWKITTSKEKPNSFEKISSDEETDDLEVPEENVGEDNTLQANNTEQQNNNDNQGYNSSFTITKSLKTGVKYYAWIKNANNNILYQTFTISKVEI